MFSVTFSLCLSLSLCLSVSLSGCPGTDTLVSCLQILTGTNTAGSPESRVCHQHILGLLSFLLVLFLWKTLIKTIDVY